MFLNFYAIFRLGLSAEAGTKNRITAAGILREGGRPWDALRLFDLPQERFTEDPRLRLHQIAALLDCHLPEIAAGHLERNVFTLCEGKQFSRELYERCFLMLAEDAEQVEQYQIAAEYYCRAAEYPENIGIGAPATNKNASILLRAGTMAEKAGNVELARECRRRAADPGKGIAIAFFPVSRLVPEAALTEAEKE